MSDTPISDSTTHNVAELGMLCRRIERQLNAANSKIELLMSANADVARIAGERDAAEQRIKRLEEARTVAAANSLANMISYENAITKIKRLEAAGDEAIYPFEYAARVRIWTEAKEAKL
jgi:hypothetical protein